MYRRKLVSWNKARIAIVLSRPSLAGTPKTSPHGWVHGVSAWAIAIPQPPNSAEQVISAKKQEGVSRPVKPGSVVDNHSSRTYVTARLKQPTRPQRGPRQRGPIWSCSEWSLPCHELLPAARCALTAPFHPYLIPCLRKGHRRFALCCTSRRLAPPRRYLALCPMEPGLSSPCLRRQRLSGPTHGAHYTLLPLCCKVVVSVASSGQITAIVQLPF